MLEGGGQERGRRSGTENPLLVSGIGMACQVVDAELPALSRHMAACSDLMRAKLIHGLGQVGQ